MDFIIEPTASTIQSILSHLISLMDNKLDKKTETSLSFSALSHRVNSLVRQPNRFLEDLRKINQLKDSPYQYDLEGNQPNPKQPSMGHCNKPFSKTKGGDNRFMAPLRFFLTIKRTWFSQRTLIMATLSPAFLSVLCVFFSQCSGGASALYHLYNRANLSGPGFLFSADFL